ncbi:MAG: hypothetical protein ACOYO1_15660 [Bacteroidales bacterium]
MNEIFSFYLKKETKYIGAIQLFYDNTYYVFKYSIVRDSICIINFSTIIIANYKHNNDDGINGKISINPINIDNGNHNNENYVKYYAHNT